MGVADVNGIDAIRELRASDSFEATLSILTAAIGKCERLPKLDESQLTRIRQAVIRLSNDERKRSLE